jgi:hypothetical protein
VSGNARNASGFTERVVATEKIAEERADDPRHERSRVLPNRDDRHRRHRFCGRSEEFADGDAGFYGGRPVDWFKERPQLLSGRFEVFTSYGLSDVTVFGEAFGAGIQKGVRCAADDGVLFRAFDILVGDSFVTYDLFATLCEDAGLPRVPEVWRGKPSLAVFDALLEQACTSSFRRSSPTCSRSAAPSGRQRWATA